MRVLHVMRHGLGDCVQFTSVLRHVKRHRPDWINHVAALRGKHTAFYGLADEVFVLDDGKPFAYDQVFEYRWEENHNCYHDFPATKTVKCLADFLKLPTDRDLLDYQINVSESAQRRADTYIATLPSRFIAIHYQGNTSKEYKDLPHEVIRGVCNYLLANGFTPVILDWDRRSPLPDNKSIFCPDVTNPLWQNTGTGDAETLAALLKKAAACIMIDSGPQKVAFAVNVPTVAVWTKHHPLHYCDFAYSAIHLVPHDHDSYIRGDRVKGNRYFTDNYVSATYRTSTLESSICSALGRYLKLKAVPATKTLTATAYDTEYYEQHKDAGLDYCGHGDWQEKYGKWIVESLDLKDKTVLDVGCACGSIAAGLGKAGALVSGCDCNEHMIQMGRSKWLRDNLKVCDAVNLHYWSDETFDLIHSAQVFEHFKPRAVPLILEELHRVTKPGGILLVFLDTTELFERQRRGADEDATHICVKRMGWWLDRLIESGWLATHGVIDKLKLHPLNFWKHYDWEAFAAVKV